MFNKNELEPYSYESGSYQIVSCPWYDQIQEPEFDWIIW